MSMLFSVDQIFQSISYFSALLYVAHAGYFRPDFSGPLHDIFSLLD